MNAMLSLLVLRAREPERLARFYELLGMGFERHRHGSGPEHFSAVVGGVFEIYPLKEGDLGTCGTRLGFMVEDVERAFAALVEAGGKSVVGPRMSEWGVRAVVDDVEGHRIELTERKVNADMA